MAETAAHPRKSQVVEDLKDRLVSSRVVGLASVSKIPGPQMQSIRSRLRGKAEMKVVKNRLLLRALEAAAEERKGIDELEKFVDGQVALVLTDSNPFRLFRELEATKTKAPAKGGETAPEDIVVNEGDTPFKPGPVVGDLQKAGIPAAIERGKVVIKKDKVLVEQGQRIPRDVARALSRLEIYPLTVGLDLHGVVEDGTLFTKDVLAVDEGALQRDLKNAIQRAYTLAMALAYPSRTVLPTLLANAQGRALALGLAARYPEAELLPILLSRAHAQGLVLASRVPDTLDEESRAKVEAPPPEEPTEEKEATEESKGEKAEEKEDKDDEEEAAAGLSSLFG